MSQTYQFYAFISYNSHDTEWGKRLQRKLEHYRMPSTLCSEHGWERTPIKPVFFAPTDIQPGGLTEELQKRLRASRHLIVVCSPHSSQSEWVGKEIEFFHRLGRTKQIHFFIVEGVPHSGDKDTECFNPIVETLGLPEILGANIHERNYRWPWLNKERAYVQLISKLLGVEFDAIWQRHRRLLVQRTLAWAVGVLFVLAMLLGVWKTGQPVDVEVQLKEASVNNPDLPQLKDAVVTLILDNETKSDTVCSLQSGITFTNLPHNLLGKKVHMKVECLCCLPIDTFILLSEHLSIDIYRNPEVFGNVRFRLWNPNTEIVAANAEVVIDGHHTMSDDNGIVALSIPLSEQKTAYPVSSSTIKLVDKIKRMPCGEDDIIEYE